MSKSRNHQTTQVTRMEHPSSTPNHSIIIKKKTQQIPHLSESSLPVLLPDEVGELVEDVRALRVPEGRARTERVEEEEVLLPAELAVVTLRGLLLNWKQECKWFDNHDQKHVQNTSNHIWRRAWNLQDQLKIIRFGFNSNMRFHFGQDTPNIHPLETVRHYRTERRRTTTPTHPPALKVQTGETWRNEHSKSCRKCGSNSLRVQIRDFKKQWNKETHPTWSFTHSLSCLGSGKLIP